MECWPGATQTHSPNWQNINSDNGGAHPEASLTGAVAGHYSQLQSNIMALNRSSSSRIGASESRGKVKARRAATSEWTWEPRPES